MNPWKITDHNAHLGKLLLHAFLEGYAEVSMGYGDVRYLRYEPPYILAQGFPNKRSNILKSDIEVVVKTSKRNFT